MSNNGWNLCKNFLTNYFYFYFFFVLFWDYLYSFRWCWDLPFFSSMAYLQHAIFCYMLCDIQLLQGCIFTIEFSSLLRDTCVGSWMILLIVRSLDTEATSNYICYFNHFNVIGFHTFTTLVSEAWIFQ